MNSLLDTIDKIQSNSYRDTPVSNPNNLDPSSSEINQKLLGIDSPDRLMSFSAIGGSAFGGHSISPGLIYDGTNVYDYDYENRLISAIGGQNSTYTYDGFGRRVSKTVGGLTTYFIYDGDQVIEERDASGLFVASYIYGSGIDEVLTMGRNSQRYFYFYDGLGSVTDVTDRDGEVIDSYSYDVYGQPSQTSSIDNPYYFTGRRLDDETGLYYYRARMYSPAIGRFMQRDYYTWAPDDSRLNKQINLQVSSLLLAGFGVLDIRTLIYNQKLQNILQTSTLNSQLLQPYSYVFNNPINFVDSQGTIAINILAGILGLGIGVFLESTRDNWTVRSLLAAGVIGFTAGFVAPVFTGSAIAAMGYGLIVGSANSIITAGLRNEKLCLRGVFGSGLIAGMGSLAGYAVGSLVPGGAALGAILGSNIKLLIGWATQ